MSDYYSSKLSAERLRISYELASPRVRHYLNAEVDYILQKIKPNDFILELGCGYGRVLNKLGNKSVNVYGIDLSYESLKYGREQFLSSDHFLLFQMNAQKLGFISHQFDIVICIQNGISAFGLNPQLLIKEALRVTKPGGSLLFSSYSQKFWDERLRWFQTQAEMGLIGEIDYGRTGEGIIICIDGFKASTFSSLDFEKTVMDIGLEFILTEVDDPSIFCEIIA